MTLVLRGKDPGQHSSGEEIHVRLIAQGTALSEARIILSSQLAATDQSGFVHVIGSEINSYLQAPPLQQLRRPRGQHHRPATGPVRVMHATCAGFVRRHAEDTTDVCHVKN